MGYSFSTCSEKSPLGARMGRCVPRLTEVAADSYAGLAEIYRHEDAFSVAFHQQGHALGFAAHHALHLLDRGHRFAVDGDQHVTGLDAGTRRGATDVFDHHPALALHLTA